MIESLSLKGMPAVEIEEVVDVLQVENYLREVQEDNSVSIPIGIEIYNPKYKLYFYYNFSKDESHRKFTWSILTLYLR